MSDRQSTCPRCQASLPAEAAACPACGAVFGATTTEFAQPAAEELPHPIQKAEDANESSSSQELAQSSGGAEKATCPVIDFEKLERLTDWNMGLVLLFFGYLLMTSFT